MKNALFLCLLFFVFSCKPNVEYSEERLELLATNLDSLLVDLGKSGKLIDSQNATTMPTSLDKIKNLFDPANFYNSASERDYKIPAKSLIDTLNVNDTLHIYYKEYYGCLNFVKNICVIVKNKNDYTVLQQNINNYPNIYFLRGDSILVSFYDSTNKKVSNNIISTKDTNNLNKLSNKYLKQTFKNYKPNTDIYRKVKELEKCTTTTINNTDCTIIFLWKNIRQERYYKNGNCRAIF